MQFLWHKLRRNYKKKEKNEKTYTSCVYTCRNKYKNGCKSKDIKRDKIEDLVVKLISQDVLNTQEFNNLVEKANTYYKEMASDSKQSKVEFDIELKKVKDKIQKIITAIEDGLYTVSMKDALLKLEDRKKELLENIERTNNFQDIKTIDRKAIEKHFNDTFKNFPKMTFQQQKELLKLWVKDIKVTNTEVIITFNFFGQHNISLALMAPQTISLVSIRISIDKLR